MNVHVIQTIEDGAVIAPQVIGWAEGDAKEAAGRAFEGLAVEHGFRDKRDTESWENYRWSWTHWCNSPLCPFDKSDFIILWFQTDLQRL